MPVAAEIQFSPSHLAAVSAAKISSSDTFYAVPIFEKLWAFADLNRKLDKLANEQHVDEVVTDTDVHLSAYQLASGIAQELEHVHSWSPMVYQIKEVTGYYSQLFDYGDLPTQKWAVQYMQDMFETWMCVFISTAFSTIVMDRNGDAWLFSDAFDNNLDALDRAIARELDVAYHSTRFHCFLYYETLLPLFDRFYDRCVGDKLAALHRLQVS